MTTNRAGCFTSDEIAFIVRCSGRGLTSRQATAELNARFGHQRGHGSVIRIARTAGANFGYTKVHPHSSPRPGAPHAEPKSRITWRERENRFCFQPPIPAGLAPIDLAGRDDEPAPRGRAGAFGRGCKWIHGEPRSEAWQQCNHKRLQGKSYCAHHYQRTIRPRIIAVEAAKNKEGTQ